MRKHYAVPRVQSYLAANKTETVLAVSQSWSYFTIIYY